MSENIIYCYSGSGHCLHMAREIAKVLGDTDIVLMRSAPVKTDATEARRVGFVFPCYGGGLPGKVEDYVKSIRISPKAYRFAVEQYAGYLGCGLGKLDAIVGLDYWDAVSNHSTCTWLMPHTLSIAPRNPQKCESRIERKAMEIGGAVRLLKRRDKKPPKGAVFAAESKAFSGLHAKQAKKFRVSEACIGCGTCARICPRGNIRLEGGKPVFGTDCIGCLSCLQYCPKEAIDLGKITEKRERYPNRHVSPADLTQGIIHID